jgi:dolichol-phosphate mannosyltransferase
MLALFRQGFDIVSPQRVRRKSESLFKRFTAKMFYVLMRHGVDPRLQPEVGDFRLLSKRVVAALRGLREQHRFLRGMVASLGFKEALIPFEREARAAGETKYPVSKMVRFAWTAITSFSGLPLRAATGLGLIIAAGGVVYLGYTLYVAFVAHEVVAGWSSLVVLQCIFSGSVLITLGLAGDYIARIYEEVKGRPLYVVQDALNITADRAIGRAFFAATESTREVE